MSEREEGIDTWHLKKLLTVYISQTYKLTVECNQINQLLQKYFFALKSQQLFGSMLEIKSYVIDRGKISDTGDLGQVCNGFIAENSLASDVNVKLDPRLGTTAGQINVTSEAFTKSESLSIKRHSPVQGCPDLMLHIDPVRFVFGNDDVVDERVDSLRHNFLILLLWKCAGELCDRV